MHFFKQEANYLFCSWLLHPSADVARVLIGKQAEDAQNKQKMTPLHGAAWNDSKDVDFVMPLCLLLYAFRL